MTIKQDAYRLICDGPGGFLCSREVCGGSEKYVMVISAERGWVHKDGKAFCLYCQNQIRKEKGERFCDWQAKCEEDGHGEWTCCAHIGRAFRCRRVSPEHAREWPGRCEDFRPPKEEGESSNSGEDT